MPGKPSTLKGFFIDSPVCGLNYSTSSGLSGKTGPNGQYAYKSGDTVQFFLGDAPIGTETTCEKVVTPVKIFNVSNLSESTGATNLVRLLLALDTGSNPFGMTLPDAIESNLPDDADVQAMLQDDSAFNKDAESLIVALLGTTIDPATDIPSAEQALDHFDQSQELIDQIDYSMDDENLFVSVVLPPDRTGEISISYKLDHLPSGVFWYTSGQSTDINDSLSTATFSEIMYRGNWTLNLFQFADSSKVGIGDLFSFYHADGFSSDLPSGYPLTIGSEPVALQADLTLSSIEVTEVYNVSGTITVPKTLPDGGDLTGTSVDTYLTIFYEIEDDSGNEVASFNITPDISDTMAWSEASPGGIPCYQIPYATSLPAGYIMKGQIDLFHGTFGDGEEDYRVWDYNSLGGALTGDIANSDYQVLTWEAEEDYLYPSQGSSSRSVSDLPVAPINHPGTIIQNGMRQVPLR